MGLITTVVELLVIVAVVGGLVRVHQDSKLVLWPGVALWCVILLGVPLALFVALGVYLRGWGDALTGLAIVIGAALIGPIVERRAKRPSPSEAPTARAARPD